MSHDEYPEAPSLVQPHRRLRLTRPVATYVLLAIIVVAFLLEMLLGGATNSRTLVFMGAQINALVAAGQYNRLVTAMFLHIGWMHLGFNAWALLSIGPNLEAFYGHWRFLLIYFLSGIAGGVLYYLLGPPNVLSAGASGAIFGLIGAEGSLFLINRQFFGVMGRQRLLNLLILIGVNLVLGFTRPGINNLAHIGGLLGGIVLGFLLAPRY